MTHRDPIEFKPRHAFTKPTQYQRQEQDSANTSKPSKTQTSKPVRKSPTGLSEKTERVNYMLLPSLAQRIENAQFKLRSTVGKKIQKSQIVSAALDLALSDFETQGKESRIYKRLGS